jgi:hypothetical protein
MLWRHYCLKCDQFGRIHFFVLSVCGTAERAQPRFLSRAYCTQVRRGGEHETEGFGHSDGRR